MCQPNDSPQCSGHGQCLAYSESDFLCVCDAGWTGTADFQFPPLSDCLVHIKTISSLYIAGACITGMNTLIFAVILIVRISDMRWSNLGGILKTPHIHSSLLCFITSVSLFTEILMKISSGVESMLIGQHIGISVGLGISTFLWHLTLKRIVYVFANLGQNMIVEIGTVQKLELRLANSKAMTALYWLNAFFGALSTILMAAWDSPALKNAFSICVLASMTLFTLSSTALGFACSAVVLKGLSQSIDTACRFSSNSDSAQVRLRSLARKLSFARWSGVSQGVSFCTLFIFVACYDPRLNVYICWLVSFVSAFVLTTFAWFVVPGPRIKEIVGMLVCRVGVSEPPGPPSGKAIYSRAQGSFQDA